MEGQQQSQYYVWSIQQEHIPKKRRAEVKAIRETAATNSTVAQTAEAAEDRSKTTEGSAGSKIMFMFRPISDLTFHHCFVGLKCVLYVDTTGGSLQRRIGNIPRGLR